MKPENAIEVKNVTKSFKIFIDKGHSLKEKVLFTKRNRYENRQVLRGISFDVKKGEAIGLIGHNGCGKSTTLKLLTKIIYPDSGSIEMCGRVSSLIELGAGFHPDMSGRENIYTNAAIFGLTKKEIDERLDDIISFSELEEFIDNPVRTYSSGMYMRLAFSVAINVDADILLIDEILAVGDAGFQTKCFNRLKEIKAQGTTIVIVSHALGQIEEICDRSIWIHEGLIRAEGDPRDVDPAYMEYMGEERKEKALQEEKAKKKKKEDDKRWGSGDASIQSVQLLDAKGNETSTFTTGDAMKIRVTYTVTNPVQDAVIGIGIFRIDGLNCMGTNTRIDQLPSFDLSQDGVVEVDISKLNLLADKYWLDLAIERGAGIPVDYWRDCKRFEIFAKKGEVGVLTLDHQWSL